jgi:pimeloyl-ACP methyl ester carboxylesterase
VLRPFVLRPQVRHFSTGHAVAAGWICGDTVTVTGRSAARAFFRDSVDAVAADEDRSWRTAFVKGIPPNSAADLRQACPAITIGQTVGSGHFLQLEVPDQVNAMIERFLTITGLEG